MELQNSENLIGEKLAAITSFVEFCKGHAYPIAPLEVFYEFSNVCNLKCAMCAEFSAINPYRFQILKTRDRGFIELEDFDERFRSLLRGALLVHCSGFGEATFHPQFRDIVQLMTEHATMVQFTTNGQELDSDLAEFLVDKGVYRIMVSCSGSTAEDYENVYIGGHFETLLNGLKRIAEHRRARSTRYPLIEINSLGFNHHVQKFDTFVELMADHGADIVHLKRLNAYDSVPELYEHVSIMRPWLDGDILKRAEAIGAEKGVVVSTQQYRSDAVSTQREYRRARDRFRSAAQARLQFGSFGENSIKTFSRFPRVPKPATEVTRRAVPVLASTDTKTEAETLFAINELPAAGSGADYFYCMEPFKTAYVSRNGGVRPCCFSGPEHPLPGSLRHEDGLTVWSGAGFNAIRDGIFNQKYPLKICQRCVTDRVGPSDHYVFNLVRDYLDWYSERFGEDLAVQLEERTPDAVRILRQNPASTIAQRYRQELPKLEEVSDRGRQLRILLSAGEQISMIDSSVAGLLKGRLERLRDEEHLQGWIWSPAFSGLRLPVSVWHQGMLVATGLANRMRGDLHEAGIGDGAHGFEIRLPRRDQAWVKSDLVLTVGPKIDRLVIFQGDPQGE